MSDVFYLIATTVLIVLYFVSFLFSFSQKYTSGRAKLIFSFVDLILGTLATLLILSLFLNMSSMGQAFAPAAIAVVCGSLIAASRLIIRHLLGRKRELTDQQKAELMDL